MSLEIRRHHWRSISRRLAVPAGLTALLGIPLPAAAQPSSDQPTAGWQNGFFIQSTDGQNRLQIGLLTQFDGYFAVDDEADALTEIGRDHVSTTVTNAHIVCSLLLENKK